MKERFRHCIVFILMISFSGFIYGMFYKKTGIGIPCLFYEITGLYCPGCGITRMMVSLLKGNLVEAMNFNHAIFFMMPIILWIFCAVVVRYVRTGNKNITVVEEKVVYFMISIMIIYTLIRNM